VRDKIGERSVKKSTVVKNDKRFWIRFFFTSLFDKILKRVVIGFKTQEKIC